LESIAETQPQLQPALLRLSAMISQYFNFFVASELFDYFDRCQSWNRFALVKLPVAKTIKRLRLFITRRERIIDRREVWKRVSEVLED